MILYQPVEETLCHEDLGRYTAFGICVYRIEQEESNLLMKVSDVFPSAQEAENFAGLCNRLALDPLHLEDVIADTLGVPDP